MDGPTGASEWMAPEPRELPDLRGRLVDYLRSLAMHASLVLALRAGHGAISPRTGDLDRDARILIDEELERLGATELFYVDRDMTRLAIAAAETLPVHGLHPHDVPAPAGFCVFAEPIEIYHPEGGPGDDMTTPIVAASWGDSHFTGAGRETGCG